VLPRGVEDLARDELAACGAVGARAAGSGLVFRGDLEVAYRACLWSRVASRILLPLATVPAGSAQELYDGVRRVPWEEHLDPDGTLAVDAHARAAAGLNTHYVALKTKDAVVDRIREARGRRPGVDLARPALRLHVLVARGGAQVSIDLSGEPLHRRGYRRDAGPAPLKENVAAALLLRAGWPGIAAAGGALVDPMCGGGTLPIEAALLAADVAPGLLREWFGFLGWRRHRPATWDSLLREAGERRRVGLARPLPPIEGGDVDPAALVRAEAQLAAAGLAGRVRLERRDVGDSRPPDGARQGLVATNAPYGERLGAKRELAAVYRRLGDTLKEHFRGWTLALLTADARLAGEVRMRAFRRNALWNGPLRCELLQYRIGDVTQRSVEPSTDG
jgi:23S rRNA (guanine2445-N2)-methyltransferase / 23S rRNA (guanine2069-N7)-methyltransferase